MPTIIAISATSTAHSRGRRSLACSTAGRVAGPRKARLNRNRKVPAAIDRPNSAAMPAPVWVSSAAISSRNSPGKLLVPGMPTPARPQTKIPDASSGIVRAAPPSAPTSVVPVRWRRNSSSTSAPPVATEKLSSSDTAPCTPDAV